MTAISFDVAHYGETTETLRQSEVHSEGKRNEWARESLCGLFSDKMTEGDMTATLLAILKPKKPNGKPGDTLSSLRYARGGDAVRKAAMTVLDLYEAATKGAVAEAFRPIAIAFATAAPDAPKSLNALRTELGKLRSAATKEASEAADNAGNDADSDNDAPVEAKVPLTVMAERMALAISEASDDDVLAADEALASLLEAIKAAYSRGEAEQLAEAA